MRTNIQHTQARLEDYRSQAMYYLNKLAETANALGVSTKVSFGSIHMTYNPGPISHALTKERAIAILQSHNQLDSVMRNKIASVLRGDGGVRYTDAELGVAYSARSTGWTAS